MKRNIALGFAWVGGVIVAAGAGLVVARTAIARKDRPVTDRATIIDPTAHEVADTLDKVVQARFQRPMDEIFGLSRIASARDRRMAHSRSMIPADQPLLDKAEASGRAWRIFYLTTRLLKSDGLKAVDYPHMPFGLTFMAESQRRLNPAISDRQIMPKIEPLKKQLEAGRPVELGVPNWRVYARPVLAAKSCVSCHIAAKEGETLGAIVYAVEREKKSPS